MCAKRLTYDLEISNKIFKSNIICLLNISDENIQSIANENIHHFIESNGNVKDNDSIGTGWFDKNSHLENAEWLFLNSIFISLYAFFEHHLFALSHIIQERCSSKIKIADISGRGVAKYSNYLYLVGEIDRANGNESNWQKTKQFMKTRNIIVHNGGIMISEPNIKLENHELFNFLKREKVIMDGVFGHIRIRDTNFLKSFANTTFEITDVLMDEINKKYPSKWHD